MELPVDALAIGPAKEIKVGAMFAMEGLWYLRTNNAGNVADPFFWAIRLSHNQMQGEGSRGVGELLQIDGREVAIRLADGWKFNALVDMAHVFEDRLSSGMLYLTPAGAMIMVSGRLRQYVIPLTTGEPIDMDATPWLDFGEATQFYKWKGVAVRPSDGETFELFKVAITPE